MQKFEPLLLWFGSLIAAYGGVASPILNMPEAGAYLFAGLWGSGVMAYMRQRMAQQDHPWTEWIAALAIGVGAAFFFGPAAILFFGTPPEIKYAVVALTAGGFQWIVEQALRVNLKGIIEDALKKWAQSIVGPKGGGDK